MLHAKNRVVVELEQMTEKERTREGVRQKYEGKMEETVFGSKERNQERVTCKWCACA